MKRRTKIAAVATATLAGVAMVSVGFASWVISNQVSDNASGNVSVDSISDNSVTLSVSTSSNIHFGAPTDPTSSEVTLKEYKWLTNSNENKESLSVIINLSVSANIGDISVTLDRTEADALSVALSKGYVALYNSATLSETTYFTAENLAEDGSFTITKNETAIPDEKLTDGLYIFTVTLTFKWGTHFGSMNPYFYYNSHNAEDTLSDSDTTYKADALASLGNETTSGGLYDLNNYKYKFTFSAEAK